MQEKSMILSMVKDGIINVDEAVKLLNALNSSKLTPKEELEQNLYKFSKNFDNFTKDVKHKFNDFTNKENTQTFFNKTNEIFDDFTNSLKGLFMQSSEKFENEFNKNSQNQANKDNDIILD